MVRFEGTLLWRFPLRRPRTRTGSLSTSETRMVNMQILFSGIGVPHVMGIAIHCRCSIRRCRIYWSVSAGGKPAIHFQPPIACPQGALTIFLFVVARSGVRSEETVPLITSLSFVPISKYGEVLVKPHRHLASHGFRRKPWFASSSAAL